MRERLRVLLLRQRVDRPELLAPAAQPLDARDQRLRLLRLQRRCSAPSSGARELQALADTAQLERRLGGLVAQALRGDLGAVTASPSARSRAWISASAAAQARSSPAISSPAALSLASCASSSCTRSATASAAACSAIASRSASGSQRRVGSVLRAQLLQAQPRARSVRARAARTGAARPPARPEARRGAPPARPCSGAARRCSITHAAWRCCSSARAWRTLGVAQHAVGLLARAHPPPASSPARSRPRPARRARRCAAALGRCDQLLALVAARQHALGAARRDLTDLARGREPHTPAAVTAIPSKSAGSSCSVSTTHASASSRCASSSAPRAPAAARSAAVRPAPAARAAGGPPCSAPPARR